jgi:cell pole-organizing protein PopZ
MEEILASIRRIISEDDAPAAEHPAAHAAPEPPPTPHLAAVAPSPAPVHEEEGEDEDVLELTEPAPKPTETHGDLDVFAAAPPPKPEPVAVAPPPPPEPPKAPPIIEEPAYTPSFTSAGFDDERLISGGTEDKAASHFGKLTQSIAMPAAGRNLEDVVSELLRPLLKDWLDTHLPAIVEEKVQVEVDRISRRRV